MVIIATLDTLLTLPCFVTRMHVSLRKPRDSSSLLGATAEAVDKGKSEPYTACRW